MKLAVGLHYGLQFIAGVSKVAVFGRGWFDMVLKSWFSDQLLYLPLQNTNTNVDFIFANHFSNGFT